jgi:hypothetical protein
MIPILIQAEEQMLATVPRNPYEICPSLRISEIPVATMQDESLHQTDPKSDENLFPSEEVPADLLRE